VSILRVAYVINDAAFFVSHRLPLALEVIKRGGDVCIITGTNINKKIERDAITRLQSEKINHYQCQFTQGFKNPFKEIYGLLQLIIYLKKFRPSTIHSASTKANLMTALACNFLNRNMLIMSVSGMGTMFTGKAGLKKFIFRMIFKYLLKISLKTLDYKIIFQNRDDYRKFQSIIKFNDKNANIISGSGVDTEKLKPISKKSKLKKVLLPSRMLYEKGVGEFVKASKILKEKNIKCSFYLAGDTMSLNPSAISKKTIDEWVSDGSIVYLGHKYNLNEMYRDIDIVCLPSWREGFPKVLMEAASLGLPVITTNVPGCRDAVINNKTGIIVEVKNEYQLANAIIKLINNPELRLNMGISNRILAEKEFDLKIIVPKIISLYN
jgi:glycosyltransferase involved in cell wall biosynthesis